MVGCVVSGRSGVSSLLPVFVHPFIPRRRGVTQHGSRRAMPGSSDVQRKTGEMQRGYISHGDDSSAYLIRRILAIPLIIVDRGGNVPP